MIRTTKQATIASTVLGVLRSTTSANGAWSLRSLPDLVGSVAGNHGYNFARNDEVLAVAQSLGLVQKRRKSDGAVLFGIKEVVEAAAARRAEQRESLERAQAAARAAVAQREAEARQQAARNAERLDPNYEKKSRLREALNDNRWTWRTFDALARVAGLSVSETTSLLDQMDDVEKSTSMAALSSRV